VHILVEKTVVQFKQPGGRGKIYWLAGNAAAGKGPANRPNPLNGRRKSRLVSVGKTNRQPGGETFPQFGG